MSPNFTYGGQTYTTVQIGTQCWMAENLNVGTMVNSAITTTPHSDVSNNGVIEKYCYDNYPSNCATYGGLYDWDEAMDYDNTTGAQGICPPTWHIPTQAEWYTLVNFLGGSSVAGAKLKEVGFICPPGTNAAATNSSGFTGLAGGIRQSHGEFYNMGSGFFWTSTSYSSSDAWHWYLLCWEQNAYTFQYSNKKGFSMRCVKD